MVEGLIRLMNTADSVTGPINLGNPGEFTIRELAELVVGQVDSASQLQFNPLPENDPRQRRPDITLARQQLDWAPTIKLADDLPRTVTYFRELVRQVAE